MNSTRDNHHIKCIIIADDFGYHPSVDAGISRAVDEGIVTSVSIMTQGYDRNVTKAFISAHPKLDCGLHLTIPLGLAMEALTADMIFHSFLTQLTMYQESFHKNPSNLSFHHTSKLRGSDQFDHLQRRVTIALHELELVSDIQLRTSLIPTLHTLIAQSSVTKTIQVIDVYTRSLKNGVYGVITHPALMQQGDPFFESAYGIKKRNIEYNTLTNKLLVNSINTGHIELVDFSMFGKNTDI